MSDLPNTIDVYVLAVPFPGSCGVLSVCSEPLALSIQSQWRSE